jgi:phosphonate transport system ATP-binding protein
LAETLLSVRNLSKSYAQGSKALSGISFDVQAGEFLVVIGLSGSGKSTLLRCLNLLNPPTSGQIFFQGEQISSFYKDTQIRQLRKKIGMIFQGFNLIPRRSVMTNVLLGLLGSKKTFSSVLGIFSEADKEQALHSLKLVGIADKAHARADKLSGGQQQRVAIARALMQKPVMLLADEPVAALDPATCHVVMEYLRKVNKELGVTVIVNLHFLSLVREYGTRVIALKDGQMVFDGKPSEITEEWMVKIYGEGAREIL